MEVYFSLSSPHWWVVHSMQSFRNPGSFLIFALSASQSITEAGFLTCLHFNMKSQSVSCSVMSDSLQPHGAHQSPLSMGFSRQKYWSGLPFPSLGDLPDPRIELTCSALQADSLLLSHLGSPLRVLILFKLS